MGIARSAHRVRHAGICDASVARLIAQRRLANRARSPRPRGDGYVAVNVTDHDTHVRQGEAIVRYLRWRNGRAQLKRDFALKTGDLDLD
jgi:hypothetical protein